MTDAQRESYEFQHAISINRALYLFLCLNSKDDWLSDPRILYALYYIHTRFSPTYSSLWKYSWKCRSLRDIRLLRFVIPPGNHSFSFAIFRRTRRQRIPMEPSTEIQDQIRDTHRLLLFWFKTYRRVSPRGVSWSGDWLQIFVFPFSLPSARYAPYPCPVHVSTEKTPL